MPGPGVRRCICVSNQKGGVGKTSLAVHLAAGFARSGERVILLDLDPQGHAGRHLGVEKGPQASELILREGTEPPIEDLLVEARENLWMVPSNRKLKAASVRLIQEQARGEREGGGHRLVSRFADQMFGQADVVVVDTPPATGTLTINAFWLVAEANRRAPEERRETRGQPGGVVVPVYMASFSADGLIGVRRALGGIKSSLADPDVFDVDVRAIVPVRYASQENLSKNSESLLKRKFPGIVTSPSHKSVYIQEAHSVGKTVFTHDPKGQGPEDYDSIRAEIDHLFSGQKLLQEWPEEEKGSSGAASSGEPEEEPEKKKPWDGVMTRSTKETRPPP